MKGRGEYVAKLLSEQGVQGGIRISNLSAQKIFKYFVQVSQA